MNNLVTKQLLLDALRTAVKKRKPPKELIFNFNRCSQYANHDFQNTLLRYGIKSSMSRKEDCWYNAADESFFSSLKIELIYFNKYQSSTQVRQVILEYFVGYCRLVYFMSTFIFVLI
jgi:transposase InsO family protein